MPNLKKLATQPLSRRTILKVLATLFGSAAAAFSYARYFEPCRLEITNKSIKIRHLQSPLKLLHLSDFHASPEVPYSLIEKAIDLSLEQAPDIACLTGDFITHSLENEAEYRRILKKLSSAVPTFASIGNHDGGLWARRAGGYPTFEKIQSLLESSNITLLNNTRSRIQITNQPLDIIGLGDFWSNDCLPQKALAAQRPAPIPQLVLSHNPDSKEQLQDLDWDLVLCGHTHGGQLVIPFINYRPILPVRDKSFPEGLLSKDDRHIHITRGVGNLHGLRINCRPEISLLNLTPNA